MLELLRARRSVRIYTEDPVTEETLGPVLQAGLLAPSSRSIYPVEMIVIRDRAVLQQLAGCKTVGSAMLASAGAAVVVLGDETRSDAWIEDCSLALFCMQLEAQSLGIGSCWVQCRGRISKERRDRTKSISEGNALINASDDAYLTADEYVHQLLKIPEKLRLEGILSLGWPAKTQEAHALPEIGEKVHFGQYGNHDWSSENPRAGITKG